MKKWLQARYIGVEATLVTQTHTIFGNDREAGGCEPVIEDQILITFAVYV